MQPFVKKVHAFLIKKRKTLAVAESCTGGLISKLLTELPGSSSYFSLGVVTYSNKAKEKILKIPGQLIAKKGAVSIEVARKMASSVRRISGADFGIGVTGIAGPGGATAAKPVGTVFIAIAGKHETLCKKFKFSGSRNTIRKKAALESLRLLGTFL
ncbi:MAG: nicotinamide-nucleotide amidohydrolase family protein [Candidatus Omnitrophota bacterium]